ncbi:MAG: DMT family transporter [Oscillospiraceae bacterium]|nr:DMT family transporter [Oscillospiraceae bacterium]
MNNRTKGVLCITCSAFCFALMMALVRLSGDVPTLEKSFFRNAVAAVFALLVCLRDRQSFVVQRGDWKYLIARAAAGTVGLIFNFYALDHLVLSDATMLNKMSPFFAVLFAALLLREKLKLPHIGILMGAFLGSLLIIKPSFSNLELAPSMLGFLGGMSAGFAYCMVRILSKRGVRGPMTVLFFSAFSSVVVLPYVLIWGVPLSLRQLVILVLAGLAAAGGQFAVTAAYSLAPPREISVFDYSQIIFAAIFGFFLFGQIPDWMSVVGYVVICGMAVIMLLYNLHEDKPAKTE